MRLDEKEVRKVAGASGVSEKAVVRLSGSLKIPLPGQASSIQQVDVGLRLKALELPPGLTIEEKRNMRIELVAGMLEEYRSACPLIVAWLGRGDFKAEAIPDRVTAATIKHASRTAGRLRAKFIRNSKLIADKE